MSLSLLTTMLYLAVLYPAAAFTNIAPLQNIQNPQRFYMSTASPPSPSVDLPYHLSSALKKATKTLTVGMECTPQKELSRGELGTLSMQARKLKVSTLWTSDPVAAQEFVSEQSTAKGNFPGPCPVVWNGKEELAMELEVDAIVLRADSDPKILQQLAEKEMGAIWSVKTEAEVAAILSRYESQDASLCFLVDANNSNLEPIMEAIPSNAIVVVAMPAMQDNNNEIATGRTLRAKGVHAIMLRNALVGDAEDVEYCTFAIDGLTKKQSSTFNMSGLTGSANGHFGGVSSSVARTWRRIIYARK